jgi:hypothetical protein
VKAVARGGLRDLRQQRVRIQMGSAKWSAGLRSPPQPAAGDRIPS